MMCVLRNDMFSNRKGSGQRAALQQTERKVHGAGPEPRRPAEEGRAMSPASRRNAAKIFLNRFRCVWNHLCYVCLQNAEVTRQMTVARAVQDEVDAVRREMQGKLKAAQESAERQVSGRATGR